jgi:hypothetical protein
MVLKHALPQPVASNDATNEWRDPRNWSKASKKSGKVLPCRDGVRSCSVGDGDEARIMDGADGDGALTFL